MGMLVIGAVYKTRGFCAVGDEKDD